jgi:SAM-dependent methyltransferase
VARPAEVWAAGDAYEPYVGRWSRLVAREFVAWLGVAGGAAWLDVGCGTGALSQTVLEAADPAAVVGIDPSLGFLAHARARLGGPAAGGRRRLDPAGCQGVGGRRDPVRRARAGQRRLTWRRPSPSTDSERRPASSSSSSPPTRSRRQPWRVRTGGSGWPRRTAATTWARS